MKEIYILYIILSILFIVEKQEINILLNYIGITLVLAIVIANELNFGGEYISYILILIQVSALTILFGFIIMLNPNLNKTEGKQINKPFEFGKKYHQGSALEYRAGALSLLLFNIIGIIFFLYIMFQITINKQFNLLGDPSTELINNNITLNSNSAPEIMNGTGEIKILQRIGELLYGDINYIIKLIITTIILLLAIIGLFFIIPQLTF